MSLSRRANSSVLYCLAAAAFFIVFGALCAFIAYDNRLVSPSDTPAEFAQHTEELKIVLRWIMHMHQVTHESG